MLRTLSSRLSFGFTVLLGGMALAAFGLAYFSVERNLLRQVKIELQEDVLEFQQVYLREGAEALHKVLAREVQSEKPETVFFRLQAAGEASVHSDLSAWAGLPAFPVLADVAEEDQFTILQLPGMQGRIYLLTYPLDRQTLLQFGYRLRAEEGLLRDFLDDYGAAFVAVVLCGALLCVFLTRRELAGIEQVRQSAERISRGDLTASIPLAGGGEEIRNLTESFNRMQQRVQILVGELGDVVNNVAHDLRSPLTRIRGLAEMTLTGDQDPEDYREMAAVVIEESDRLVGMINTMLEIAETDAGMSPTAHGLVDMAQIVEDVGELFSAVADDRSIRLAVDTETPLPVLGDRARLQRALANLLDNALKYTLPGGMVRLTARQLPEKIEVCVIDSGPGIAASELPQVFDRFYRGDRSRTTPGSGLGLSLVQAIVRVHAGEVELRSLEGEGTTACLLLPSFDAQARAERD